MGGIEIEAFSCTIMSDISINASSPLYFNPGKDSYLRLVSPATLVSTVRASSLISQSSSSHLNIFHVQIVLMKLQFKRFFITKEFLGETF